ncbi:MAG: acyl carrier protein [Gammaproteobacteria bacterium]|nr:acyl carrier protein [Gammaproteobacteria bacterium]NVK86640.1 acyl carrier protein [Gammaproteobacteria bacterium]
MNRADITESVKTLLVDTLSLNLSPAELNEETPLLGNFPEFDSMAIVSVITSLEETFEFMAQDDDLTAEVFETIGSLVDFVIQQQNS